MKDGIKLTGRYYIELRDRWTGKVIEKAIGHNTVTTAGKTQVAKLIGAVDTTAFNTIALGEGTNAPGAGDTTLQTERIRASVTVAYEATSKVTFEHTFTFTSAQSWAITECGILNNATSGGELLNRLTFAAKNVDVNTSLYVKITITVA